MMNGTARVLDTIIKGIIGRCSAIVKHISKMQLQEKETKDKDINFNTIQVFQ